MRKSMVCVKGEGRVHIDRKQLKGTIRIRKVNKKAIGDKWKNGCVSFGVFVRFRQM